MLVMVGFSLVVARWYQEQGETGFVVRDLAVFVLIS